MGSNEDRVTYKTERRYMFEFSIGLIIGAFVGAAIVAFVFAAIYGGGDEHRER